MDVEGEGNNHGSRAQQHAAETGHSALHTGAWRPAAAPRAGDESQGTVTPDGSWKSCSRASRLAARPPGKGMGLPLAAMPRGRAPSSSESVPLGGEGLWWA